MLKRLLLLLFLFVPASVLGQTTTVTGTITDPQGNPYQNGTASAQKVVSSGQNPGPPFNTTTNGAGLFSFSGLLALPSPASYIFTICAAPVNIGPKANPTPVQQCFSNTIPIAISGASQDVSTTLNALAPTLGPVVSNITGNALTATSLQNAPAQCGASSLATGITSNGTANCTSSPSVANLTVSGTGTLCSANGVVYVGSTNPCAFAGADFGAQVNSAYASAFCGTQGCTIRVLQQPSGTACYVQTTPIVFGTSGKFIRFEADVSSSSGSNQGACINYTPTTATSAITINADNGNQKTGWGIYGLQLLNNGGCVTAGGCGSSATGITITHGSFVEIANTQINGFGTAIAPSLSGPFGMKFRDLNISNNTTGAATGTTAYENLFFERGIWQQNGTAFSFGNAGAGGLTEIKIKDISCDDNTVTCVNIANQTGLNSFILDNVHHENVLLGLPQYLTAGTGTNVMYVGGGLYDDTTTAQTQMVTTSGSTLVILGTHLKKNSGALTQVVTATSPVRVYASFVNDTQNVIGTLFGGTSTNINNTSINGINGGGASVWTTAEAPWYLNGAVAWGSIPNDLVTNSQGVKMCLGGSGSYCIGNGNFTEQHGSVGQWLQVANALFANNASATTPDSVGGTALSSNPGGLVAKEGTCPTVAGATWDQFCADSTAHAFRSSLNGNPFLNVPQVIASGTSTLTSNAALGAATCQAAITTSATGTATTDSIEWSFATAPATGDAISPVASYVTANNVNFTRCNPTAAAQNVTAIVINWRVIR